MLSRYCSSLIPAVFDLPDVASDTPEHHASVQAGTVAYLSAGINIPVVGESEPVLAVIPDQLCGDPYCPEKAGASLLHRVSLQGCHSM